MHRVIEPKIHYYGTPVILVSTLNEGGSSNLAPNSSGWWLGQQCLLGISTRGKTFQNLERERELVLNLASADRLQPQRVAECLISLEGVVRNIHAVGAPDAHLAAVEVGILRTHVHESLLTGAKRHHIDPGRWKPLIMSFLEFYSLGAELRESRLAQVF